MFVFKIVPVDKIGKPLSCVSYAFKMMWVSALVFERLEEGFDERIVVAYPRSRKTWYYSQLIIKGNQGNSLHRVPVVRMNKIRMCIFLSAGIIKKLPGMFIAFILKNHPGDN